MSRDISPPEPKFVESSNPAGPHRIAYRQYGDLASATRVIFTVHGLTGDSMNFHYLGEYFAKQNNYACINIELVGRGSSSRLTNIEDYNLERYVRDVIAVISAIFNQVEDRQSAISWYYIGTSLGGLIAMTIPSFESLLPPNFPGFSGIMLNDIGPFVSTEWVSPMGPLTYWPTREEAASFLFKTYGANFGPLVDETFFWHRAVFALDLDEEKQEYTTSYHRDGVLHASHEHDLTPLISDDKLGQGYSYWKGFNATKCPILVYRGELSVIFPQELLDQMVEARKEANIPLEFLVWPQTGHIPPLYKEEEFVPIQQFFEKY